MITLTSDLKIVFDQIGMKFQSIMDEKKEMFEKIAKNAIENFDFETVLTEHIENKIQQGLEDAFNEIDLKENLKIKIWNEINKKIEQI